MSEITLKKVVIKACKGKRMKPDEVEFFKKKLGVVPCPPPQQSALQNETFMHVQICIYLEGREYDVSGDMRLLILEFRQAKYGHCLPKA